MKNIAVFVVDASTNFNSDVNYLSIDNRDEDVINELIQKATEQDGVFSLEEFERGINDESIVTNNSWILIITDSEAIKYLTRGFLQTDGSLATMQYGKKIDDFTWEYRQVEREYSTEVEALFDFDNWAQDTVDLRDHSILEMDSAINSFGYTLDKYSHTDPEEASIYQAGVTYTGKDAIQLICECLFELNN
ncbi:MAG: hypothetical protein KDH96_04755 [Candidatus Riesia sp.]|nr:hypothetical protein [Candidatus Riesia sp.]